MARKFKKSMLEYAQVVLSKISFDKKLFHKELRKAFRNLDDEDRKKLVRWIRSRQVPLRWNI